MKRLLPCIVILLICLTACAPKPQIIRHEAFCPAPVKPVIEAADRVTVRVLLDDLLNVVEYSRALELQIECYEAANARQR